MDAPNKPDLNTLTKLKRGEISYFDLETGLSFLDEADVADAVYARAERLKDYEALHEAVLVKLTAWREFVLWWDAIQKDKGGRPSKTRIRPDTGFPIAGQNGLPERLTISRQRKRLKAPEKFEIAKAEAFEHCRAICDADKSDVVRGTQGTGENEWFTPPELVELARGVLGGIDLDPATHPKAQEIIQASQVFTKADDGLTKPWRGRVWLNPPYAQPLIDHFVTKMVIEVTAANVEAAIMLTHNYTDTAWFHRAAEVANAICFTRGRVKFYEPDGEVAAPTQGQAFFYFGNQIELFVETFKSIGFVVAPLRKIVDANLSA
jgi:phage N-6-adenine-methyltransferase